MTFSVSHGTQVEYLAADGRTYLWYPGNRVVLNGAWRYAPIRAAAATLPGICFRYGAETFNPSTGVTGGRWECEPLAIYRRGIVEAAPGDIFDLGRRASPPFALGRERTSLKALREQVR